MTKLEKAVCDIAKTHCSDSDRLDDPLSAIASIRHRLERVEHLEDKVGELRGLITRYRTMIAAQVSNELPDLDWRRTDIGMISCRRGTWFAVERVERGRRWRLRCVNGDDERAVAQFRRAMDARQAARYFARDEHLGKLPDNLKPVAEEL